MVTACENLVTKQEFNELKQQLNALLGKVETGTPVNVLAQGNFDGTLIGDQLEFATNSVQNIEFQDTNGASVTTFDDNTLEKLAAGALTIVALKGKDLYVPLKILTKSVVSRAGKIYQHRNRKTSNGRRSIKRHVSLHNGFPPPDNHQLGPINCQPPSISSSHRCNREWFTNH